MNELLKINYDTETPTVSARDLHEQLEPDMFLQLAYATFIACLDGRREDKFDSEEYSIIKACESKNDSYYTKCEQYVPTQADMLAEDWVFAE